MISATEALAATDIGIADKRVAVQDDLLRKMLAEEDREKAAREKFPEVQSKIEECIKQAAAKGLRQVSVSLDKDLEGEIWTRMAAPVMQEAGYTIRAVRDYCEAGYDDDGVQMWSSYFFYNITIYW